MFCRGRTQLRKGKKYVRCRKKCLFIYCSEHWKKKRKVLAGIVGTIIAGLTFFILYFDTKDRVKELTQTPRDKFQSENYIRGLLIPYKTQKSSQFIDISFGSVAHRIPLIDFRNGISLQALPMLRCGDDGKIWERPINLFLKLEGERVKISTTMRSFQSKEIIGEIKNNSWVLYKQAIIDFYENDQLLEVVDKQGYVVLGLSLSNPNNINIRGYFVGDLCTCFSIPTAGLKFVSNSDPLYFQICHSTAKQINSLQSNT